MEVFFMSGSVYNRGKSCLDVTCLNCLWWYLYFNLYCWCALKWAVFSNFIVEPADRYNTALVCHRWRFLACHPRLWLRVERPIRDVMEPGVYPNLEAAVSAARSISLPPSLVLIGNSGCYGWSPCTLLKARWHHSYCGWWLPCCV